MLVNVTQSLQVRIIPVNNPAQGGADSGYKAVVGHDYSALIEGMHTARGDTVPKNVGFGQSRTARIAVLNAVDDYVSKFGPLCIDDTEDPFGDNLPIHKA